MTQFSHGLSHLIITNMRDRILSSLLPLLSFFFASFFPFFLLPFSRLLTRKYHSSHYRHSGTIWRLIFKSGVDGEYVAVEGKEQK